jgi:NAD(P)-dependent dehydrogenase (short-subunit alcohol dehydrogenase family)
MSLPGKTILITGSARRVGKALALAAAQAGMNVIIHHAHSPDEAAATRREIQALGVQVDILEADLSDSDSAAGLIERAWEINPLVALVNNAAVFAPLRWDTVTLPAWDQHLAVNLTAPFILSQAFARHARLAGEGRIVNILDWRALRPGADHLPYTISKAGLAALTQSLALALAPEITVNGIALGAILPPSDGAVDPRLLDDYPARRWADLEEVGRTLLFLLDGPTYITGEIIHLDGGRHLV